MQYVKVDEVSFTIASGASSGTGTLDSGFDDLSQMVCWATCRHAFTAAADQEDYDIEVWPNSTSQITAQRNGTPSVAINVRAFVVQFGSDTNVYKGTSSISSSSTNSGNVAYGGSPSDLTETFGWCTQRGAGGSGGGSPGDVLVRMSFPSTTQVYFDRWDSPATAISSIRWFALQSDTLNVQHDTYSGSPSSSPTTDTFGTAVTLADTFLQASYKYDDEGAAEIDSYAAAALTGTTELSMYFGYTESYSTNVYYQVIEDSNQVVQRGNFTHSGTSDNTSITEVDLDAAILKSGFGSHTRSSCTQYGADEIDTKAHELWFGSSSQVNTQSGQGATTLNSPWEVIELDEEVSARRVMIRS